MKECVRVLRVYRSPQIKTPSRPYGTDIQREPFDALVVHRSGLENTTDETGISVDTHAWMRLECLHPNHLMNQQGVLIGCI